VAGAANNQLAEPADADRLRDATRGATSAVVAGGGWIAAEVAASLRQVGLEVTLVVPGAEVLERHLGPVAARELSGIHERNGVRLVRSSRVVAIDETGGRRSVRLAGGDVVEGDLAVLGLGATPATELAVAAGLAVEDGIVADEHLATAAPGVFVAGDVASAWNPRYGERVRSEHWDNARRQGRTAARNMLGGAEAYDRVPYFFSDQFDLGLEMLGRPGQGSDILVRREDAGIVAAWVRDGAVVAAMHTNLWDTRKPLDRLVSAGARIDAARFVDPSVPLAEALALPG
jgi:3-phenylpropionate/trans-cinnamate dioxygenase ferredoxin reductase subunit